MAEIRDIKKRLEEYLRTHHTISADGSHGVRLRLGADVPDRDAVYGDELYDLLIDHDRLVAQVNAGKELSDAIDRWLAHAGGIETHIYLTNQLFRESLQEKQHG